VVVAAAAEFPAMKPSQQLEKVPTELFKQRRKFTAD
jgi:hypothetical protein